MLRKRFQDVNQKDQLKWLDSKCEAVGVAEVVPLNSGTKDLLEVTSVVKCCGKQFLPEFQLLLQKFC